MTPLRSQDAIALFNQGLQQLEAGNYNTALACFDSTLNFDGDNHEAWCKRGDVLSKLGRYEEAIASYDHALSLTENQDWQSWLNRGWALYHSLNLQGYKLKGYKAALENWDSGLQIFREHSNRLTYEELHEGRGVLHYNKGKAHYLQGQRGRNSCNYWRKAVNEYNKALQTLTLDKFPEQHLEVLQDLIKVFRVLGEDETGERTRNIIRALHSDGIKLLYRLLSREASPAKRFQLAKKFASFNGLTLDQLAQSPEPAKQIKALEIAEELKNLCLDWLRHRNSRQGASRVAEEISDFWHRWEYDLENYSRRDSLKYTQMQELPNSHTAAIYWHISPAALTTFVLQYNQPLITWTLNPKATTDKTPKQAVAHLEEFEDWIKQWKESYQDYRNSKTKGTDTNLDQVDAQKPATGSHPWRLQMQDELKNLAEILGIKRILEHLDSNVNQLILIPHRDLHLLPLNALFLEKFIITYLPSVKIGLDLQQSKVKTGNSLSLLSIEHPETQQPLLFAEIESAVLANLYQVPSDNRIAGRNATKDEVKKALQKAADIFHFTGHGEHDIDSPADSALVMAKEERLTIRELFDLRNLHYYLVCLSACETGLTNTSNLIDEFIGLVSCFLAKGTTYVLSTLWTVDERSTALLVIEFYRLLKRGKAPAPALKQAQSWLHYVTYKDLAKWYRDLGSELKKYDPQRKNDALPRCIAYLETEAQIIETDPNKLDSPDPPYAHPYHWASFILTGKPNSNSR